MISMKLEDLFHFDDDRPHRESQRSSSAEPQKKANFFEVDKKTLYEISDDPQRKEFLDDLFSFMQKKGSPINRLPIMAKSVLDLYELYNLVIARGGLVEVINKKLWQEIIKGLRLPSSITSAAFTLRTQYMKYLYEYECEKKNLSTRSELDAAIEGNKREGRRSSGQYDAQAALAMPPLSRVSLGPHLSSLPLMGSRIPPLGSHIAQHHMTSHDAQRMSEYLKVMSSHHMLRNGSGAESPPNGNRQVDIARLAYSVFNGNPLIIPPAVDDMEPQREALNLSESPNSSTSGGRRESHSSPPPAKRERRTPRPASPRSSPPPRAIHPPAPPPIMTTFSTTGMIDGANYKVQTRVETNSGVHQLVATIEINGVTYEGVLSLSDNGQNGHRHRVS